MKAFATKHPLILGALLFLAALIAVVPVMLLAGAIGLGQDFGAAVGRIAIGLALADLFPECFRWDRSLSGLPFALPVLAIVVWNLVYHLLSGSTFVAATALMGAVLLGLAPAVFEEVVFRGVVIGKLREGGRGDWLTLWSSSLLFALMHLTNAVGMNLGSLLVQVGYSLVVGLLLGAIYFRSSDILTVILSHAAIDISNQLFVTSPTASTVPMLVAFAAVLALEVACALWIMRGGQRGERP